MIVDEVIWEIINNGHCSFKAKLETNVFCKNEYNVSGLCNRNSCPLANSRYATITEEKGACFLQIKTAERAHTPKDLWEKIKLDKSYNKALEQIDEYLMYFPEFLKHKCKQRFTRYRQVLVKKRKLKLQETGEYEIVSRKATKREKSRGKKAEKAALIEHHTEQELLSRLKEGKYDEVFNINRKLFQRVLKEKSEKTKDIDSAFNEKDYNNIFISDLNKEEEELDTAEVTMESIKKSNKNLDLQEGDDDEDYDSYGDDDEYDGGFDYDDYNNLDDIDDSDDNNEEGDQEDQEKNTKPSKNMKINNIKDNDSKSKDNKKDKNLLNKKRKNKIMYEYNDDDVENIKEMQYN